MRHITNCRGSISNSIEILWFGFIALQLKSVQRKSQTQTNRQRSDFKKIIGSFKNAQIYRLLAKCHETILLTAISAVAMSSNIQLITALSRIKVTPLFLEEH